MGWSGWVKFWSSFSATLTTSDVAGLILTVSDLYSTLSCSCKSAISRARILEQKLCGLCAASKRKYEERREVLYLWFYCEGKRVPDICTRTGPLYGGGTTRCRCALLLSWVASYYLTTSVTEIVTDLPLYYCKESTTFVLLGLSWLADHFCGIAALVQL